MSDKLPPYDQDVLEIQDMLNADNILQLSTYKMRQMAVGEKLKCIRTLERENNQLREDLKQCAEALSFINGHYHLQEDPCGCYSKLHKALSLPSVQTALREEK